MPPGLDPLRSAPPHHRELAFGTGLAALIEGLRTVLAGVSRGGGATRQPRRALGAYARRAG
ncbi:hypothetical protein [Streptomyces albidoflavus]|uniref:hypothetical protein n=1 Tax=Streptomyces albidoflavus TaxID=1886 RepID=UPI001E2C61AD|nr:hypothetical protein [Streptomyces albidoflavus]